LNSSIGSARRCVVPVPDIVVVFGFAGVVVPVVAGFGLTGAIAAGFVVVTAGLVIAVLLNEVADVAAWTSPWTGTGTA
jgi:hypothetical protein